MHIKYDRLKHIHVVEKVVPSLCLPQLIDLRREITVLSASLATLLQTTLNVSNSQRVPIVWRNEVGIAASASPLLEAQYVHEDGTHAHVLVLDSGSVALSIEHPLRNLMSSPMSTQTGIQVGSTIMSHLVTVPIRILLKNEEINLLVGTEDGTEEFVDFSIVPALAVATTPGRYSLLPS